MPVRVKLPPDPLINILAFSYAIARAVSPAGETGVRGIDCIVGKRLVVEGIDGAVPSHLTNDERSALQKLLPKLPRLRCPISSKVAGAFLDAYRTLPGRFNWEPELVSEAHIPWLKQQQNAAARDHGLALWNEYREGRLTVVDSNHTPRRERPDASDFITRDEAIAYLNRYKFSHMANGTQRAVGERKVADPEEVYAFCLEMYQAGYKNYNQLTCADFDISDRQVRKIINQIDEARGEPSPFPKQKKSR